MTEEDLLELVEEVDPVECIACEAEFIIVLADDLLESKPSYCPFCAEAMVS